VRWPDSRYLVIPLSGELEANRKHGQILVIRGWHRRYDLRKGSFDVPSEFVKNNANAISNAAD
jgi:hypothetical protein